MLENSVVGLFMILHVLDDVSTKVFHRLFLASTPKYRCQWYHCLSFSNIFLLLRFVRLLHNAKREPYHIDNCQQIPGKGSLHMSAMLYYKMTIKSAV